jgi:hypothetical protein
MKRLIIRLSKVLAAALAILVFGGCELVAGPDEPVGSGRGNLLISLGGGGRAITSGADLPADLLAALRYEIRLTGPNGEVLAKTVTGGENLKLTVALGQWQIEAQAYQNEALAGTGILGFTVAAGSNTVRVPMKMAGDCYEITVDSGISHGTIGIDYNTGFEGATITVTAVPEEGYILKSENLKYNDGVVTGSGPYTFTMPASDVTVSAVFSLVVGITIEGPLDEAEAITVTPTHSTGHTPPTEISWAAGASVTFTLDSDDYTQEAGTLKWFVNDSLKTGTGNSLTINARDYALTTHSITVMVKVNGQWYSAETSFTVGE